MGAKRTARRGPPCSCVWRKLPIRAQWAGVRVQWAEVSELLGKEPSPYSHPPPGQAATRDGDGADETDPFQGDGKPG